MTREDIIRMAREADLWLTSPERIEAVKRFAALVAAAEAEKHKWDIHSCGPTCGRYACIARRKAVEAEREACAELADRLDPLQDGGIGQAIRARGEDR